MLMHFAVDRRAKPLLVNRRRPGRPFPTYPTSPAVARLMAGMVVNALVQHEVPVACSRATQAERWADRALTFRLLDPSMESGQLLLEVAQALLLRVHRRHSPASREARHLGRALLEKLCRDCLWGIDRNALALRACDLVVALLGTGQGVPELRLQHLHAANALTLLSRGRLPVFDGVINNPPWGEDLSAQEREALRQRFPSITHRADTYVSFAEFAVRSVRPGGTLALVLPSQALTARNAQGLRELLLERTELERIVLLPRAAFADATVRGAVVAGRVAPPGGASGSRCRATVYPLVKRLDSTLPPRSFTIPTQELARLGGKSWAPLLSLAAGQAEPAATVPLQSVATVAPGVQVYCLGRGRPRQTREVVRCRPYSLARPEEGAVPAIRGRNVRPFRILDAEEYVRFGKWLARTGDHEAYRRLNRIFVRELCRRDGRLSAAVARDGVVPLHGVLTVIPAGIDLRVLVGILNSGRTAAFVRAHAASFSKVDFQRITVEELRRLPVPVAALGASTREGLGLERPSPHELALARELIRIVEELSDVERETDDEERFEQMEAVVAALFSGHAGTS